MSGGSYLAAGSYDQRCAPASAALGRAAPPPAQYTHVGCYHDQAEARDLSGSRQLEWGGMATEDCFLMCNYVGYDYFGLQAGDQC